MFIEWASGMKNDAINKEVISIDGKSIRGSSDSFHAQRPIHMVSVWASTNELVLGQLKVADKSNEITVFRYYWSFWIFRGALCPSMPLTHRRILPS